MINRDSHEIFSFQKHVDNLKQDLESILSNFKSDVDQVSLCQINDRLNLYQLYTVCTRYEKCFE